MTTYKETKSDKIASISTGLSFAEALTILFVGLKVTNIIGWSWWLVFSPLIIQYGIIAVILIVLAIIWLIASAFIK